MSVLVTVGTTQFDLLIQQVDKVEFHDQLLECGYRNLFIQYGSGEYVPKQRKVRHSNNCNESKEYDKILEIKATPYMKEIIYSDYDLIIGHAGAGTILNSLRNNRKMIVVINESLMDNHQVELATQLHNDKHLIAINNMNDLRSTIKTITTITYSNKPPENQHTNSSYLIPFPKASNTRFKEEISKLLCNENIWKN
ncbi:glycosyl transferase [Cryptosporidium ubiquitum]|uniref:UDP-N-acetylglucosamine transferase subunit ALG13 n=1 Tax=Cryptosporidium ubiquitum TaxID=857276 RepID=A0A1J4MIT1_9CRYT|nr:glycosyl transferase [Cryptosporidium ubiquitum]OII72765.1 glycosyl transferase [Cryptosporidium ubiquitum]